MIILSTIDDDLVIKSKFITGKTNYKFALDNFYPLINRLDIQRNLQNASFYRRLKDDLLDGCIMPPITLAIITDVTKFSDDLDDAVKFITDNIQNMFILDGIQRLNTLNTAYLHPESDKNLDLRHPIFLNILVCSSMDNLLYRMITLNNGQKPMSANHQIEILLGNIYQFDELSIKIVTDKEKGKNKKNVNTFEKSNIIKGYLAFITESTSIDNKKIIDEKMDNLITKKIMESKVTNLTLEFSDVISLINNFSETKELKSWFDNSNNIIGFCVGIKKSYDFIKNINNIEFNENIKVFEKAFKSLNLSSIKLSKERRNLTKYYISKFKELRDLDEIELLDNFNDNIL
ncbi:hypothetical protein [Chryseobacterium sp. sg2396]|uniref:hypothetical protein n=1 Tax=Chryseobacterium sp. sg2396 TaxID=3276280 RepID=UPI00366AB953